MRTAFCLVPFVVLLAACGGGGGGSSTSPSGLGIRSVNPGSGPEAGGNQVAVNGTGFNVGIRAVLFDGIPATDLDVTSDSNINCITPPHATSAVDVTVAADSGESVTLENGYVYNAPPRVFAVVPQAGAAGLTVSIVGWDFDDGSTQAPTVLFGDQESVLPQLVSTSLIFATVPGGQPTTGAVDVTVINGNGQGTRRRGFVYLTAATIGNAATALQAPEPERIRREGYVLIQRLLALWERLEGALGDYDLPTRERIVEVFKESLHVRDTASSPRRSR